MRGVESVKKTLILSYTATAGVHKDAHKELITLLLGQPGETPDHPLDVMITKLVPCRSYDEAARILRRAEQETTRVAN